MAKKEQNPSFYVETPEQQVTARDFDIFYKPQPEPKNPVIAELAKSLSGLVPALQSYNVVQEIKDIKKQEAQAVADLNANKVTFEKLVKDKQIPQGANPHYWNKMMELHLNLKAREWQRKFDEYYAENDVAGRLSPDAFNAAYVEQMEQFYKDNELKKYDPLALNNAFFKKTSEYRTQLENKHEDERFKRIKEVTEDNFIKNISGTLIDLQKNKAEIADVNAFIRDETQSLTKLGTSNTRVNDLWIKGFKNYLEVINDDEGFDYARKIVDGLSELKFTTAFFAGETGTKRGIALQGEFKRLITAKELNYLQVKNNRDKAVDENKKQTLSNDYFKQLEDPAFDLNKYILKNNYVGKDKEFLLQIHAGVQNAKNVTTSDGDAIVELNELQKTDPYKVRSRATELLKARKLTLTDYKAFDESAGRYNVLESSEYFRSSRVYQNYKKMFDDKAFSQYPTLTFELPLIKNEFEKDLVDYYQKQVQAGKSGRELQNLIDAEIKLLFIRNLQKSVYGQNAEIIKNVAKRYGIYYDETINQPPKNNKK